MSPISHVVGQGAPSHGFDLDVLTVQRLLNRYAHQLIPLPPLVEDGRMGAKTIAAIMEFQRRLMRMPNPDGRVDPHGKTIQALEKGPGNVLGPGDIHFAPLLAGHVIVRHGANRPGVGLTPTLLGFLRKVAARYGSPITVTRGTQHSQYSASGLVSDHWEGNGADIAVPVDSVVGDQICTAALVAAGKSSAEAAAAAQIGGLWNLHPADLPGKRVQIIWRTDVGGNHHDHVHVGIK
jgi:hypothetical protein